MSQRSLTAVILAAGLGTRLRSRQPKVLHSLAGTPMIDLVVELCAGAGVERPIVVLNPAQPQVADHLGQRCDVVFQHAQRGTGHALSMVPSESLRGDVLVLSGDSPLIRRETVREVLEGHRSAQAAATISTVNDPRRRDGRIVRDAHGGFDRIVEERDATEEQRRITETNVGLYCFRAEDLPAALAGLKPGKKGGEIYLTDAVARMRPVELFEISDPDEALGINDRVQLARAEKVMRRRLLEALMLSGVTVTDADTTFVDAGVTVGQDTVLEPFTILRRGAVIGEECRIGPYADIGESQIGDRCRVEHSWLRGVRMGGGSDCGPFVKLRPGTTIGAGVHIGSFAEINRSSIGPGSAVPHFSYLGDAVIGSNVNIGAGTITANYDGVTKHTTEIGDGVHVGVHTSLRAPVKLGEGSRTGAGAVVLTDVPPGVTVVGIPARERPGK